MGGSAGGLTALAVAAVRPDDVDGVVVSYPVVDLAEMLRHEDDFEGHYMPALIGEHDPDSPSLAGRGPLARAAHLARTPILVFHGDMDHSVPIVHSERLVEAVRAHDGAIEFVVMPGEGHGFKAPAS
ncbi:MAG: alpha/beta hydrolase family protein [Actinomycetota bacterium]